MIIGDLELQVLKDMKRDSIDTFEADPSEYNMGIANGIEDVVAFFESRTSNYVEMPEQEILED